MPSRTMSEPRSKLSWFPPFYPDEPLYSTCSRYDYETQYDTLSALQKELFGNHRVAATMDFPSHIDSFVEVLPIGHHYSTSSIIANHTILPFFSLFMPERRADRIYESMAGRNGSGNHYILGTRAWRVRTPRSPRYCVICCRSDIETFGEPYWHRVHQLPGILACPHHASWLETASAINLRSRSRLRLYSARESIELSSDVRYLDPRNKADSVHMRLAEDAFWLLSNFEAQVSYSHICNQYQNLLAQKDFVTYTGEYRRKQLRSAFVECFPDDVLTVLSCKVIDSPYDWLDSLLHHQHKNKMPVQHLLLMQFLGVTAEQICKININSPRPFGEGPWPCLSPTCRYSGKLIVSSCKIDHTPIRILGVFRCDCGFEYCRRGPDKTPEDRYRIGKIINYGHEWFQLLERLNQDTQMSLRAKARRLGVETSTVRNQTQRLAQQPILLLDSNRTE